MGDFEERGGEPSDYSKEVAKGSLWSLAGNGVFYLMSFFYNIIIARAVSQDDLGIFFLSLSITSMAGVFDNLGLAASISRYVPFFEGRGEKAKIRSLVKLSQVLVTLSAIIAILLLWFGSDAISQLYGKPELAENLRLFSLYMLLTNIFGVNSAFIRGRADIKSVQVLSNLQNALKLVITLTLFFLFGATVFMLTAALLLSFIPSLLLSFWYVRKKSADLPEHDGDVGMSLMVREILPFGLMVSLTTSVSAILFSSTRLLLGYLAEPSEATQLVAMYSVSATLAGILMTLPGSIGSIFLPLMSRLYGKNDMAQMRSVTETAQRWSLFMAIPFGLVMIAFSSEILALLYGEAYRPAGLVMAILTFGILLKVFSYVLSITIAAMRLISVQFKMLVVSGAVTVLMNILLIPLYGMLGAALATVCGFVVNVLLLGHYSRKHFGFILPPEILKLVLAALAAFIPVLLLEPGALLVSDSLMQLLGDEVPFYVAKFFYLAYLGLLVCITIVLFAVSALALKCFRSEDISMMRKAMHKVGMPKPLIRIGVGIASRGIGDAGASSDKGRKQAN